MESSKQWSPKSTEPSISFPILGHNHGIPAPTTHRMDALRWRAGAISPCGHGASEWTAPPQSPRTSGTAGSRWRHQVLRPPSSSTSKNGPSHASPALSARPLCRRPAASRLPLAPAHGRVPAGLKPCSASCRSPVSAGSPRMRSP